MEMRGITYSTTHATTMCRACRHVVERFNELLIRFMRGFLGILIINTNIDSSLFRSRLRCQKGQDILCQNECFDLSYYKYFQMVYVQPEFILHPFTIQ